MTSTKEISMNSYIVVATFKDGITVDDIRPLIPAEQAQAKLLEDQGKIGSIKIAMPRRTVFIEAFGVDEAEVVEAVTSLPMAQIWDIEFYEVTPPAGPGA
jgi:hypothetical protein